MRSSQIRGTQLTPTSTSQLGAETKWAHSSETPSLGARARAQACVVSQRGQKQNVATRDTWARDVE
ncbi:unnamed protein product [Dovyalis caffra]|uniref:Uncharacterized protein n=1 Tax=Dovyalis caffra TaxID=77055 RepID=A0AAV1S304_9ROSI|nr:unnamed protein product [Dovyalis caffra]